MYRFNKSFKLAGIKPSFSSYTTTNINSKWPDGLNSLPDIISMQPASKKYRNINRLYDLPA
jgi:hypothetical protein